MTKYILVGGYPWKAKDEGKAFYEEIAKGFTEPIRILICAFARPQEEWDETLREDKEVFIKHLPAKKIDLKIAQPESFIDQVKWAQAIFFRGGSTSQLLNLLKQYPEWINHIEGKTVAGTSAGADMVSKYFVELTAIKLDEGLGLLPIKVLVHYKSDYNAPRIDWDKAYKALDRYKEKLQVVTLREGEYKVISK